MRPAWCGWGDAGTALDDLLGSPRDALAGGWTPGPSFAAEAKPVGESNDAAGRLSQRPSRATLYVVAWLRQPWAPSPCPRLADPGRGRGHQFGHQSEGKSGQLGATRTALDLRPRRAPRGRGTSQAEGRGFETRRPL